MLKRLVLFFFIVPFVAMADNSKLPNNLTLTGTSTSYTFGTGETQMGEIQIFVNEFGINTLWAIIGRSDSNNITDHDLDGTYGKMCSQGDEFTSISPVTVGCERGFTQNVNIVKSRVKSSRSPACAASGIFANYSGVVHVKGSFTDTTVPGCAEAVSFNKVMLQGSVSNRNH